MIDSLIYIVYHICVSYYEWDKDKNQWLIENRGVSFELCVAAIGQGDLLDIIQNKSPRAHQYKYIIKINDYIYVVPFVIEGEKKFLKTMYPSRVETKKYLPEFYE